jgi:SAM-dependent methyltransferase
VRQAVLERLLQINREFYQSLAGPFAETRSRLQPGVLRALEGLASRAEVLDLGCGNGELAAELQRRGHTGAYVGVDSSAELLELARGQVERAAWQFAQADLVEEGWAAKAGEALRVQVGRQPVDRRESAEGLAETRDPTPRPAGPPQEGRQREGDRSTAGFKHAFAFAVLHHIPGAALRLRLMEQVNGLLAPGGRLSLSVWSFLASPQLRKRIQPWLAVGISEAELDPGDFLLDWRRGGRGLRYVHHFTEPELAGLAEAAGFQVLESYLSDGEGGALGRYQVWQTAGTGDPAGGGGGQIRPPRLGLGWAAW